MNDFLSLASIVIQLVALVAAGIWAVSAIKSTTVQLTATIDTLEKTVSRLAVMIAAIETKAVDHEVRIQMLEHHTKPHRTDGGE